MELNELGYNENFEKMKEEAGLAHFQSARVFSEHKERYVVRNEDGLYDAEVSGRLRFTAEDREDFPSVGDWVAAEFYDDGPAIIHGVIPRRTVIARKAASSDSEKQVIAANIDKAFIITALDRDFSPNRIGRYLTIVHDTGIEPVIILSKSDLLEKDELDEKKGIIMEMFPGSEIVLLSNINGSGIEDVKSHIEPGKTICFVGSSGVGKSTLLNLLAGEELFAVSSISESTSKGRHTTSHREMVVLENGGLLIDTPGMRELGISDSESGIEMTFSDISELAQQCRFDDCTHTGEPGCAVLEAVETGGLDPEKLENYRKLTREAEHYSMSAAEKKKKDKDLGKIIKEYKNLKKNKKL